MVLWERAQQTITDAIRLPALVGRRWWRRGNRAGERNSVIEKGDDVLYFLWFK